MVIETCPICGGDLMDFVIATYPPIQAKQCNSCGWRWEAKEEVIRVPFNPSHNNYGKYYAPFSSVPLACKGCSNHPSNGGSGVCNCTLGSVTVT